MAQDSPDTAPERARRVYTRGGDDGSTGLLYGGRVAKDSAQPTAYGDVDELQACIGLARAAAGGEARADLADVLLGLERDLWVVMAELACNPEKLSRLDEADGRPTIAMVERLEALIDTVSARFDPPTEFVVPGQNEVAARLDLARSVCRRAERASLSAAVDGSAVVPYLNRLSDLLWTLARWQDDGPLVTRSVPSDPTT
ncbi:MAG: cob(I)yrinic acid a,c-diamide adenosyltransferase [Actinobacteria bacterium]|jgi:cob(I)alamin adenosyltransferase|nr:cob(I)yrinic acid a,c-diamide adenosyltransferase [Actinomycetota bacterium]